MNINESAQPLAPPQDAMPAWHVFDAAEALAVTESDGDRGLSRDQVRVRLAQFGPNKLLEPTRRSLGSVFVGQFKSPLIYLLFVAAGIAFAMGHHGDAVVIFVVVLINSLIGTLQEGRAQRSLEALRKLATHKARVVRDGHEEVVDAGDVVPGDIIVLEAGDSVPADARLLYGAALQVAEAALTGESMPVAKQLEPLPPDTLLADRRNMAYAGTHVTAGRARAVVVTTGLATEIGHIAALAGIAKEPQTPLERRVAQFGRYIIVAAGVTFIAVIVVGLVRGVALTQIVMIGISQLVGMIPEGLPVAMTIALAVGVQRMARRKAVVRRLAAVETLGSTTVICSDKTGTLTRSEMTVVAISLPFGRQLTVTGAGYAPEGVFVDDGQALELPLSADVLAVIEAGLLCNDAQLVGPSNDASPQWKPVGDPTEVALVTLGIKAGIDPGELRARIPRRAEIPFDPAAKLMATQHDTANGSSVIVKGAPEVVLELCHTARRDGIDVDLDDEARVALRQIVDGMAASALRVLAIGMIDGGEIDSHDSAEQRSAAQISSGHNALNPEVGRSADGRSGFDALRGRVTLLGFVGQIDPPRSEVKEAVARCRLAGIRAVIVTGDHKATGLAIARELGIAREGDAAVDGAELERLSDAELGQRIDEISVFARVHPAQKLRIVDAYQRRNQIVAMTGDGVNDAPALVKANVGVAMGITGTEVAKDSAKIVIGDDNFATIVAAVEEGRVVYRNIKKAVLLLFSTSAAEVAVLLLAMILGYPSPFAAVQILWNNLVTEGLITVNLVMEPAEGEEMRRPPIPPMEPLLTRILLTRMAVIVPAIVVSTLGWFIYRTEAGVSEMQVRTEAFTLLAICEWYNVLNCRSETKSALTLQVFKNVWLVAGLVIGNLLQIAVVFWEPLGRMFYTVPLGISEVIALGILGSAVLWVEELRKLFVRRRHRLSLSSIAVIENR